MRRLLLLLLTVPLAHAASQETAPLLRPGALVRFVRMDTVDRATGEVRFTYPEGRLESADARSLLLRPASASSTQAVAQEPVRVPVMGVIRVESFSGLQRHAVAGALLGLTLGAATGYLTTHSDDSEGRGKCANVSFLFCSAPSPSGNPIPSASRAARIGATGMVAGALVGYLIRTERWTQIDLEAFQRRFGIE